MSATTIITKNGSGAPAAGDLVQGELAVDLTNQTLYSKDSSGNVFKVGDTGGGSPGTFTDLVATDSFTSPGIDDNATSTQITVTDTDVDFSGNIDVTGTATLPDADVTTLDVTGTTTLADVDVVDLDVTGSFTSPGIDDNATSTAITIDASQNVGIGADPDTTGFGGTFKYLGLNGGSGNGAFNGQTTSTTVNSVAAQYMGSTTGTSGYQILGGMHVANGASSAANAEGALVFYTATGGSLAERMRIVTSGAVSMGGPSQSGDVYLNSTTGFSSRLYQDVSDMVFGVGSGQAERMRIDDVGNVGIGNVSPSPVASYKVLQVRGSSTTNGGLIRLETSDGTSGVARLYAGSGSAVLETTTATPLTFRTSATDRLTIDAAGTTTVTGGFEAAQPGAGTSAFAAGINAGLTSQNAYAVAIGIDAGKASQGANGVAVGAGAAADTQGLSAVAVGNNAGRVSQSNDSVAVGAAAGKTSQGGQAVAIGLNAGQTTQQGSAVAIGRQAGETDQGFAGVSTGYQAGQLRQGDYGVAIGHAAGLSDQGARSVAVGLSAGQVNQGASSVALGHLAGQTNQAANSIVISSLGSAANAPETNSIRLISTSTKYLHYNGTNAWTFSGGNVVVPNDNLQLGLTGGTNRRLYLRASANNSTNYACQMENSAAQNLFFIRSDGAFNTGEGTSSPYNNTTTAAANLNVSSNGFLGRSTSSIRYKENVRDYTGSIDALRPVMFNSINEDDDKDYAGFIAEEVHETGLVEFVQYDDKGRPDLVNYANIAALLVKEVQDLKAEVAALKVV